ncbi:uncharacterized protein RJT21DRAFT_108803 [Scheffersomyces amazonensis]|uniref:uncharacterized protein n=1 Tax=Scheffersomyces amazonensis TaxID=1078765 RepID=UPI00315D3233
MADPITCHILNTTVGKPAHDVLCQLYYLGPLQDADTFAETTVESGSGTGSDIHPIAMAKTDKDGRIKKWIIDPYRDTSEAGISNKSQWTQPKPGLYKIKFYTAGYFKALGSASFFPWIEIHFQIEDPADAHYHIPLLLSNHSYTTYRGS